MKIDELIKELEAVKEQHGNLEVVSHVTDETKPHVEEMPDDQKKLFLNYY